MSTRELENSIGKAPPPASLHAVAMADFSANNMEVLDLQERMEVEKAPAEVKVSHGYEARTTNMAAHRDAQRDASAQDLCARGGFRISSRCDENVQGKELLHVLCLEDHADLQGRDFRSWQFERRASSTSGSSSKHRRVTATSPGIRRSQSWQSS
eukprot:15312978-Heterocapsa_arctica.AAC.1